MKIRKAVEGFYRGSYPKGEISLLKEAPCCQTCKGCVYDSGMRYRYCWFTGEILPAFDKMIGAKCPIEWKDVEE